MSSIEDEIRKSRQRVIEFQENINHLNELIEREKLKQYLLRIKANGPSIISATDKIKEYQYLSKKITLATLGLTMVPIWITRECIYPRWSREVCSLKLLDFDIQLEKNREILSESISNALFIDYRDAEEIVLQYKFKLSLFYGYDYHENHNIRIDFSQGEIYENNDDILTDYMLNTVDIKYILVYPTTYDL